MQLEQLGISALSEEGLFLTMAREDAMTKPPSLAMALGKERVTSSVVPGSMIELALRGTIRLLTCRSKSTLMMSHHMSRERPPDHSQDLNNRERDPRLVNHVNPSLLNIEPEDHLLLDHQDK